MCQRPTVIDGGLRGIPARSPVVRCSKVPTSALPAGAAGCHTVAYRLIRTTRRAAARASVVSSGSGTTMPQSAQTGPAEG